MADTDANSLLDLSLAILEGNGLITDMGVTEPRLNPDSAPTHPGPAEIPIKTHFSTWLSEQKIPEKYKTTLELGAWLCSTCNIFNGLDTKYRIRKTCSKCKKVREGNRTVLDELVQNLGDL